MEKPNGATVENANWKMPNSKPEKKLFPVYKGGTTTTFLTEHQYDLLRADQPIDPNYA